MIRAYLEYNVQGCLLYAIDYPGAYARGKQKEEAMQKLKMDVNRYLLWLRKPCINDEVIIIERKSSTLHIEDADTDALFAAEQLPLAKEEYFILKERVLYSAQCFEDLYQSIPKKLFTDLLPRTSFYGKVPRTPKEMYDHTNEVTNYYMGEIGVVMENDSSIVENRKQAFILLEQQENYLANHVCTGSFEERWCLRKVLRRFLWHDAIHAKAMYRLGVRNWGNSVVHHVFYF